MRFLLDTHVWLWMLVAPERLGATADVVRDRANQLVLSAVSTWEIAIKVSIGRLDSSIPSDAVGPTIERLMAQLAVESLDIEHRHAARVSVLPFHHRDPFDRLLVAQALVEGLPIITADRAFDAYDCEVIPVGR